MGPGGYISDIGTDGSTNEERALRYGTGKGFYENLTFGLPKYSAELIVLSMYVDDGVTDGKHRKQMMDPLADFSGVWNCFWDADHTQNGHLVHRESFASHMVGV